MQSAYVDGLKLLSPEIVLVAVSLVVLVYDLVKKGRDSKHCGWITLAGLAIVAWLLVGQWNTLEDGSKTVFGMVRLDRFGVFFKLFTVASLAVVTLFVLGDRNEREHGIGEYYFLLLGAAIGAFFMVSTNNLLLMMLGLELLSLASYALAGFHKGDRKSAEAAMKYVIFGGLSAGIMLYGISLLYGFTGTIDLAQMAGAGDPALSLATQFDRSPVPVAVAIVLILAGFAYKVSVVPFHWWTPDVYEGAPTPVTTFLAVASKAAGFAVLLRFVGALFLTEGLDEAVAAYGQRIGLLLGILAAVTMTLGNFSALRQNSLKRLLAYSSIAHAGYVLMGLSAMTSEGFNAAVFYLAAYYLMNLGAFGVVIYFEGITGTDSITALRGMGAKAPLVSIAMVTFLVSLTGLPPTIGFIGKLALIYAVIDGPTMGLVLVLFLAVNTVVSLFYYFRIVKALFLESGAEREARPHPLLASLLVALAAGTVIYGLEPASLESWSRSSTESLQLEQR